MQTSDPKPITLPPEEKHAFPFHIANLQYDLTLAKSLLGEPTYQDLVEGLGDADYWAFAYPCGLRLAYEFIRPLSDGMLGIANVMGDLPEIEHAIRHLPFPRSVQTPATLDSNSREIEAFSSLEPWAKQLTKLDAKCWVAELESHGHKQTYWYTHT